MTHPTAAKGRFPYPHRNLAEVRRDEMIGMAIAMTAKRSGFVVPPSRNARCGQPDLPLAMTKRYLAALEWLPSDGSWSKPGAPWQHATRLVPCRKNGLVESKKHREYPVIVRWRLTPLGAKCLEALKRPETQP